MGKTIHPFVPLQFLLAALLLSTGGLCRAAPGPPVRLELVSGNTMAPAPAERGGRPVRVAMMNLICEDNSYRSTQGALDFTTALQAEVTGDALHQWVERAELDQAEKELHLSGFGLIDRSEAIRGGRWVKADWAVFGRISTNSTSGRSVYLEVVDLGRADELAETNLTVAPQTGTLFRVATTDVALVNSAMRSLLEAADRVASAARAQTAVALLSFAPTMSNQGFALKDGDLENALESSATNGKLLHLIRFQRAGEAMDEASMVLSGLAESDPDAWEKVADQYIWGTYEGRKGVRFDAQTRGPVVESEVKIALTLWDAKTEPRLLALTITNDISSQGVARQLAQAVAPLLVRPTGGTSVEGARQSVAALLLERFNKMKKDRQNFEFGLSSPEGRRAWLDAVKVLEAACFFDPGNAAAREQWLRLRWGKFASLESRNEFVFARRRSEEWGKYVDQFGFKSALASVRRPGIASEYVLSAWRPFEMFHYAQENQQKWGIPKDAGLRELTGWQNQFGSEFVARLLAAPDDPLLSPHVLDFFYASLSLDSAKLRSQVIAKLWPQFLARARNGPIRFDGAYLHALKRYFDEIGQPTGDQKLLAQLDAANQETMAPRPPEQKIKLPRLGELDTSKTADAFSLRSMSFLPPLSEPVVRTISFPKEMQVKSVKSMVFHDDVLWLVVEATEPAKVETRHDLVDKDITPVMVNCARLWRLAVDQQMPQPVGGPLATNIINGMLWRADVLWLALDDDGVAALNLKTGDLKRYETPAGITSTRQFALADVGRGIAAIGGMSDFLMLEDGTETWKPFSPELPRQNFSLGGGSRRLAASKNKLLLYNSQLLLCNLPSNAWTRIADRASADRIGRVNLMASDDRGHFWIATSTGLHDLDPETGKMGGQWVPISPMIQNTPPPGIPDAAQHLFHKTDAQLVLEIRRKMELRRQFVKTASGGEHQTNRFVPSTRLLDGVLAVAPDGEFLWVLAQHALLLYHPMSRSFAGGFSLGGPGTPLALACGGGNVWIGSQQGPDILILKIDGNKLKSTPRQRWLADAISSDELAAQAAALPRPERAVYDFFTGDDAAAIRELHEQSEEDLDAQAMFLLAAAYAETGQTEQAAHFQDELHDRFPGSVFAQVLNETGRSQPAAPPNNNRNP